MTDERAKGAAAWLDGRPEPAPPSVRTEIDRLMADTDPAEALHDRFAAAALWGLEAVLAGPSDRRSAIPLLAADALLTYACEAAAKEGLGALDALTASLDLDRFSHLLTSP